MRSECIGEDFHPRGGQKKETLINMYTGDRGHSTREEEKKHIIDNDAGLSGPSCGKGKHPQQKVKSLRFGIGPTAVHV